MTGVFNGNNVRGGKYAVQRKVKLVGGLVEEWADEAGFYLYDRRVWVKDPCWENGRWHSLSYRSVDEFEYIYIFWKPGVTTIDRSRLNRDEWSEWGSRAVWNIPSVRANIEHEAQFPIELPSPRHTPSVSAGRPGAGLFHWKRNHRAGGGCRRTPVFGNRFGSTLR